MRVGRAGQFRDNRWAFNPGKIEHHIVALLAAYRISCHSILSWWPGALFFQRRSMAKITVDIRIRGEHIPGFFIQQDIQRVRRGIAV